MNDPICINLSDISPLNSPPGLSPSSTEASFCSSDSSNSDVTSPTTTDPGSDISTSTSEEIAHDGLIGSESGSLTSLLDSRLLVALGHDLELAARLIPRIHDLIQYSFVSESATVRVVPAQGVGSTGQTSAAAISDNSRTASRTARGTNLKHRKNEHDSEEEEEETRRNKRSKRPRKWDPNSSRPRGFACPFHRKDPEKYGLTNGLKYRTCIGPGPIELRRIK